MQNVLTDYWIIAGASFLLMVLFVIFAIRMFPRCGLMDRPERYGLKRKAIPYYGGILIFLAFMLAALVFVPLTKALIIFLIGGTMIMAVGFFDDLMGISPMWRLLVQFLASLLLVYGGIGIYSVNLPLLGTFAFGELWPIFTVVWVMVIVNTMNFVDGVSGLSSGVGFIAGMTLFFLSINPLLHADPAGQTGVAVLSLILAMVSLGFLLFDFPKPKILMGDTGSTFLGFAIASLAIFSGGKVATAFLVLGLPILDMVWVVLRRLWKRKKIWHGDLKHLHHRLLDIGFSEKKVVAYYLVVTALFGISAVLLVSSQQKFFMMIALGALMLILAGVLVFLPNKRS